MLDLILAPTNPKGYIQVEKLFESTSTTLESTSKR